jgi:hypothetical protein
MKAMIALKRNDPQWAEVRPPLISAPKDKFEQMRIKLDELAYEMKL